LSLATTRQKTPRSPEYRALIEERTMHRTLLTGATLATLLLAACKDDDADRPPFCQAIGGGAAVASQTCTSSCGVIENVQRAVDADFGSYATIGVSVQNQASIRGTAQDGLVFEGAAGVYVHKPPLVNGGTFDLTITTYLDGVPQETQLAYSESSGSDNVFCNQCGEDGANNFYGIPTNLPFDAIEMSYTQSAGTQYREIRLFEFCVLE
jgi:hypothetical protein